MTLSFLFDLDPHHYAGDFKNSRPGMAATTDRAVLLSVPIKFFISRLKIKPKEEVSILRTWITITAGDS